MKSIGLHRILYDAFCAMFSKMPHVFSVCYLQFIPIFLYFNLWICMEKLQQVFFSLSPQLFEAIELKTYINGLALFISSFYLFIDI